MWQMYANLNLLYICHIGKHGKSNFSCNALAMEIFKYISTTKEESTCLQSKVPKCPLK